ncbi:XdhC family protein [Luteimonas sp. SX5]|uniref:XdhC family protein n=1 Tax=Luteimonas galliterrae TaxID=2940486 RepID=A0ABT0MJ06_9GAMM|nr:XdhC/CoxI family protein [Luteimonas galliterrae]MCL1634845.1 XdhC family protein [Luteimonas galliterrae]
MSGTMPSEYASPATDGLRAVLEAAADAIETRQPAVLALVVETEGSTYVGVGAMALFGAPAGQVGWLSGGCLEPEIERRAGEIARTSAIGWMDIDTRDDEDLLSGSALGCRGRLRIALLPLLAMPGFEALVRAWLVDGAALDFDLDLSGTFVAAAGDAARTWQLAASAPDWPNAQAQRWRMRLQPPPKVIVFGAGPETPTLLPLLRGMGWMTTLAERRPRWLAYGAAADRLIEAMPAAASQRAPSADAALVMHHNFELDREALSVLADGAIPFVGLLGPVRRREDLFRLLTPVQRAALSARLRSPIGLKLGGSGPQAIALSIAAQLQAYRHGEAPR